MWGKKAMYLFMAMGLLVGLNTMPALATAISDSDATMTWPLNIAGSITWTSKQSISHAFAANDHDDDLQDDYQSGWVTTSAGASVTTATANATTTSFQLYEDVWATADGVGAYESFADAEGRREGYFTANASGYVTVSTYYQLNQSLSTEQIDEQADGAANAHLRLGNGTQVVWDVDVASLINSVADGQSLTDSDSGTLTVQLWFDAGEEGFLESSVNNMAWVIIPEPSCLIGLCGGALLLRRRRR